MAEAEAYYRENPPKGEFVLVVAGAQPRRLEGPTLEEGVSLVAQLRDREGLSLKDAARRVAAETGLPKNELYQSSLTERKEGKR